MSKEKDITGVFVESSPEALRYKIVFVNLVFELEYSNALSKKLQKYSNAMYRPFISALLSLDIETYSPRVALSSSF